MDSVKFSDDFLAAIGGSRSAMIFVTADGKRMTRDAVPTAPKGQ